MTPSESSGQAASDPDALEAFANLRKAAESVYRSLDGVAERVEAFLTAATCADSEQRGSWTIASVTAADGQVARLRSADVAVLAAFARAQIKGRSGA